MNININFISAGAGSGKTYTLTEKMEEMLSSGRVEPAGVIATTFTKLAAGELKERVRSKLILSGRLDVANQMEQSLIGTVNSICGEILRRFTFEAGMPPDQQVLDEVQSEIVFYRAMEQVFEKDTTPLKQMNDLCHRLQINDKNNQMKWRAEIKSIVDAARANNQSADDIRHLGRSSADQLLSHFPAPTGRNLDNALADTISAAISDIDTKYDATKKTRDYLSLIKGIRTALQNKRVTWAEWISLTKKMPGTKSKSYAEPIADIAIDFEKHPRLQDDIRNFVEKAFEIAADTLDAYQQVKTRKGLIDFVDQEQRLYKLLENPTVKQTLKQELQLLMVDEFQDTSPIQLALFLKLSQLADQVIWVGDVKQSIYGFRGSDPSLMSAVVDRIVEDGQSLEILEKSWRSTPDLVAYANNLFAPAFSETLSAEQVTLEAARKPVSGEPAVELWRLAGKNKKLRSQALVEGILSLFENGKTIVDKETDEQRKATFSDIAILCRTNVNLEEIATALAEANLPIRYNRAGLLNTPEASLAIACFRRLIDPLDTLATAEIHSLTTCENPENWIGKRLDYLKDPDVRSNAWLEDIKDGPLAALKAARSRLPFLTPVEALRVAMAAGDVRKCAFRWGPSAHQSQHRMNNLSALLQHADDYIGQCEAQNEPATSAGLILWLYALKDAGKDTQAGGESEDAIQLITHHGAKGLEWPIVIAMDLEAKLNPRIWGLSVLPSPEPITLENPLAGRTLRYWPSFFGLQGQNVSLIEEIEASPEGVVASKQETAEVKRLLYVSLTRPRDALIITMPNQTDTGPWMGTLDADWMLPGGDMLALPDGTSIPSRVRELSAGESITSTEEFKPFWPLTATHKEEFLPLKLSPSNTEPAETAKVGEIISLGDRLEIKGDYDPAALGSALHAVIATTIFGQDSTKRVLTNHKMQNTISKEAAEECVSRFLGTVSDNFKPIRYYSEYPIQYELETGQRIAGWIDLLLETDEGFILIDHKASPRAKSEWEKIALSYSGQLQAYANGVTKATGKPVFSKWIHFAVTGGLVQLV